MSWDRASSFPILMPLPHADVERRSAFSGLNYADSEGDTLIASAIDPFEQVEKVMAVGALVIEEEEQFEVVSIQLTA